MHGKDPIGMPDWSLGHYPNLSALEHDAEGVDERAAGVRFAAGSRGEAGGRACALCASRAASPPSAANRRINLACASGDFAVSTMLGCSDRAILSWSRPFPSWFEAVVLDFLPTCHRALDYVA